MPESKNIGKRIKFNRDSNQMSISINQRVKLWKEGLIFGWVAVWVICGFFFVSQYFISEDETELAKFWSLSDYQIENDPDDKEQLNLGSTQRMDNISPSNDLLMPTMLDLEGLTNRRSTIIRTDPEHFDPPVNLKSNSSHNDNTGHTKDCKNQR